MYQHQQCENCRFWSEWAESHGQCRRHPPRIIESEIEGEYRKVDETDCLWAMANATTFPVTNKTDWCGEWAMSELAIREKS